MISVVCGVRDRLSYLLRSLPTWLACPEVGEVVVVDWSSAEPVVFADLPSDDRVVVARVDGQEQWVASKCLNLGLDLARGGRILRLDADDLLERDFFAAHPSRPSSFYRFDDARSRDANERHLMGVVFADKEDILAVNGYNERIVTYGYDDEDLVRRLCASGLTALPLDLDTVHHVPHGDELRTACQVVPGDLGVRPPWEAWNWKPGKVVDNLATRNRHLAKGRPWGPGDVRTGWVVELVAPGYYVCKERPL